MPHVDPQQNHTTSYLVFPTRAPLLDGPNSRHRRTPWDTRVGAWVGSLGDSVATVSGASGFWKSTSPPFRTRSWILHEPLMFLWLLAASLSKIWCSGSQLPPAGQNGLRPVRLQPLAHDTLPNRPFHSYKKDEGGCPTLRSSQLRVLAAVDVTVSVSPTTSEICNHPEQGRGFCLNPSCSCRSWLHVFLKYGVPGIASSSFLHHAYVLLGP